MKKFLRKNIFYRTYKKIISLLINIFYANPGKGIKFIGVTGTDGKTTTNEMIYYILKKSGKKVGILSTISIDIGNGKQKNETKITTLQPRKFYKYIKQAKKNGIEYMVVEPSSHAIYQYRFVKCKFIAVGITNLTHEHLDFHGTMKHYFQTKAEIFYKSLYPQSFGIYPAGLEYEENLKKISKVKNLKNFSQDFKADFYIEEFEQNPFLTAILVNNSDQENIEKIKVNTQLLGSFNLDNILIAFSICKFIGISLIDIKKGIESFSGLPGRQEILKTTNNITIIIDFALTPNALKKLRSGFKQMNFAKQIAVFGATGSRDKQKRPIMGELAIKYNDLAIITEDENYLEKGEKIIEDISKNIKNQSNYKIIQNRKEAIKYAISIAQENDIILLTGMGNFNTRTMGKKKIKWNDKNVVVDILEDFGYGLKNNGENNK